MTEGILNQALADLTEYPLSSAREIAKRLGVRDDRRVFRALDNAAYDGLCQRSRVGLGAWRWELTAGGEQWLARAEQESQR